jgi:glycosyltransferase involved in cell wall biosynthesis
MKPAPTVPQPEGSRPRVLLLAAACNPYKGSDFAVGWGRVVGAAARFDTWAVCGHWDQEDISRYLVEHGEIPGLHFCFLEPWWLEERMKIGRPLYYMHFLPYHLWHRRAFKLAERLHRELKFDLFHQVTLVGYREPGCLWKLNAPFIWGPVGGTQNYPWRFLRLAGVMGALKEGLRSIINFLQFRFSPGVRKALRKATFLLTANSKILRDFERVHKIKPVLLLDIGLQAVKDEVSKKKRQNGPLRIMWSGQFDHHKALPLLLHALADLPSHIQYELRILGKGPLEKRWQKMARKLRIDSHCQWLGWREHREALKQYDWADIFVFTSLRDTAGNVLLEALGRGVPIVCLDHQGAGDIVTNDCGIKIPVTTTAEVIANLRDHLVGLSAGRLRVEALSRGALKRARQYLWSCNEEQMARVYCAALQAHHADKAKNVSPCDVERIIQGNR